MHLEKCIMCGEAFTSNRPNTKTCGKDCRRDRKIERQKKYQLSPTYKAFKEKERERWRRNYHKHLIYHKREHLKTTLCRLVIKERFPEIMEEINDTVDRIYPKKSGFRVQKVQDTLC